MGTRKGKCNPSIKKERTILSFHNMRRKESTTLIPQDEEGRRNLKIKVRKKGRHGLKDRKSKHSPAFIKTRNGKARLSMRKAALDYLPRSINEERRRNPGIMKATATPRTFLNKASPIINAATTQGGAAASS